MITFIQNWGPTGVLVIALLLLARSFSPLITALVDELKSNHAASDKLMTRFQESDSRWAKSDGVITDVVNVQSKTVEAQRQLATQMNELTGAINAFSGRYDARASVIDGIKTAQADHITASATAATEIQGVLGKIDKVTAEFEGLLKSRDAEVLSKLEGIVGELKALRLSVEALAAKPVESPVPAQSPLPVVAQEGSSA